jgi:hypothetical protein
MLQEFDPSEVEMPANLQKLELLKLHGSVNFRQPRRGQRDERNCAQRLITAVDNPLILPPVFNKATDAIGLGVWNRALEVLRRCKNLIICGYSLPATDIYMQYFLKAALGPNQDLNQIFVFDPALFDTDRQSQGEHLKTRYPRNFSEPIQRRIQYNPPLPNGWSREHGGKMSHMTTLLVSHPDSLLFG